MKENQNENINYNVVEFSLEKAKIEGNKVVLRLDHSFEPEWHYFKEVNDMYKIVYVKNGLLFTCTIKGINNIEYTKHENDLIILEPIKEVKVNAIIKSSGYSEIKFKLLEEHDVIDSMTSLFEITFINNKLTKIEKI